MPQQEVLQAFRFALDPTDAQCASLSRHTGAARWAFNFALSLKVRAHQAWRAQVAGLVAQGADEKTAKAQLRETMKESSDQARKLDTARKELREQRKRLSGAEREQADTQLAAMTAEAAASVSERITAGLLFPKAFEASAYWRTVRDQPKEEGGSPWWGEVSSYAFSKGFQDADAAWKNWSESRSGKRAGSSVGYPRFKKKGRARDSFTLYHDVKKPTIRLDGYRKLTLPRIGTVRTHDSGKRLVRLIGRGQAVVQSVTVSRSGHRWYASVLAKVQRNIPDRPTARQRVGGLVGVDLGSQPLAVLTDRLDRDDPASTEYANPKHLIQAEKKLARAQQKLSRTQRDSGRRARARAQVARIHHQVAQRRATTQHHLTKALVLGFAHVAVEDLGLRALTASATGTVEKPGRDVAVKARFNRHLLDAGIGEICRQISYKASWYGSELVRLDRAEPAARTCSRCGAQNPSVSPADTRFTCVCGLDIGRRVNSARNIRAAGRRKLDNVASDSGETVNARGAPVSL